MAIDEALLKILVCPETKLPVSLADASLVAKINADIQNGKAKSRSGQIVKSPIDAGLLRSDRTILYPIREDIPIMLVDEGIVLSGL
jgi:uncharacterized protein YbaR (Trm112 family)